MEELLSIIRCPVTGSVLTLTTFSTSTKVFMDAETKIVWTGILYSADTHWFYPVIDGIPRLTVEAFDEYESFLKDFLPDYDQKRAYLLKHYGGLIKKVKNKNKRTRESFTLEWNHFDYQKDKTWDADPQEMLHRFLQETSETHDSLRDKLIFDAGCGNGLLDSLIAGCGATVIAMDLSLSTERAFKNNHQPNAFFIEGDVQFPPVAFERFDIVHSSGVLHHTENTELSLSCIDRCVRPNGKLSVWLYHPRKSAVHNFFNFLRLFTSRFPLKFQYYLYLFTFFPISFVVKRIKGNKQNKREMMIDIMDEFSPQFRHEHTEQEAINWLTKRHYHSILVTTRNLFGFNITGVKYDPSCTTKAE